MKNSLVRMSWLVLLAARWAVAEPVLPTPFDVNDVSFLFPLPKDAAGVAAMVGLTETADAPLGMPRADYLALVPSADQALTADSQPNPVYAGNVFKVVALRADPCAKDDPAIAGCRIEFRVVLQPVTFGPDGFHPGTPPIVNTIDAALHLSYEVPPEKTSAFFEDLVQLNMLAAGRTAGVPLGVHPVLAQEGMAGPYGRRLQAMIARYAQFSALRTATHMLTEHSDRWFFFKTTGDGRQLRRQPIPHVDGFSQEVFSDGNSRFALRNPSTSVDNANRIVDSFVGVANRFLTLSKAEQLHDIDSALRIDNPKVHGPMTVDCVSCHVATRAVGRATLSPRFVNLNDGNPARYVVPAGITGQLANMEIDNPYSVRAFGYFFFRPSLTKGVVNDSARVAAWMNHRAHHFRARR